MIQTKAKRKDRTTDKVCHKLVATALKNTGDEGGSPLLSVRSVVNNKYFNIVKNTLHWFSKWRVLIHIIDEIKIILVLWPQFVVRCLCIVFHAIAANGKSPVYTLVLFFQKLK